jgi:cation-transporting ATPase 13A2
VGRTESSEQLSHERPPATFTTPSFLFSLIANMVIMASFLCAVWVALLTQSWYIPVTRGKAAEDNYLCQEATTVFLFTCLQYLAVVLAFSTGKPFRKPVFTNGKNYSEIS